MTFTFSAKKRAPVRGEVRAAYSMMRGGGEVAEAGGGGAGGAGGGGGGEERGQIPQLWTILSCSRNAGMGSLKK